MATFKRTTTKDGNSKRTTTLSSKGTTHSYSNKPTKDAPRRTVSFNTSTGKTRTTFSQKLGGGYTRVSSKTTGGTTRPRRTRKTKTNLSFPIIFFGCILIYGMYLWPVTIPYVIGALLVIGLIVFILSIMKYIIIGAILLGLLYLLSIIAL